MIHQYNFTVDLKDIKLTPEIEEDLQGVGKDTTFVYPIRELQEVLPKEIIEQFASKKKVWVACNFNKGMFRVDVFDELED